ncbi:MAG TPA: flagellar export protein FliJ [Spirochaetota bacterium]|nr:flagellar export protein FliJ [Spirochaetota bacterium]
MKKYSFKLERLLKIKEYKERIAEENYAKELQKKIILEQENINMKKLVEKDIESDFINEKIGEKIDINYFHQHERYVRSLELKIEQNKAKIREYEPGIKKLQDELIEATKEKKIMEKLKEKDYEKYKDEKNKYDTKVIDEIAGIIQNRKES